MSKKKGNKQQQQQQDDEDIQALASELLPLVKSAVEEGAAKELMVHLKGIDGVFQLTVIPSSGNEKGKGTWHAIIKGDKVPPQIVEGPTEKKPTVWITLDEATLLKLATGKSNPVALFVGGKLKISGNIMLAQRLEAAFKRAKGYEKSRPFVMQFVELHPSLKSKL